MSTEVVVLQHNSAWADMFNVESKWIVSAIGHSVIAVHHIGSTAIPGIVAKPVIDILVVVMDIQAVDHRSADMEALGYEVKGEFGIVGRRYFRKHNEDGIRTHHVHVFQHGSDQIDRHLAFRDFMIAHPDWATRYSELKLDLANKHPKDMSRYIEGKDNFIKQVDQLAATWNYNRSATRHAENMQSHGFRNGNSRHA